MNRNVLVTLFVFMVSIGIIGCEKAPNAGGSPSNNGDKAAVNTSLAGNVNVDGSSTVEPISNRAKEMFNESFPKVNIAVSGEGTGNGFKALSGKECDFSDASRPIKKKELDLCTNAGVNFYEIPVAYDGLTIAVNNDNDFVKELTVDQLKMIFREDMAAKTWKEVNDAWPDKKIAIFAPGVQSGTHDYFVEVIGKKDGKKLRSPADGQTMLSEDDKVLVTGVKNDKYAIGFFGFSYYDANKDELKAVPIVNPKTSSSVTPSMETIESGDYAPFSRPLFIYVNTESYQKAQVKEFVDFYLENIVQIVKEASYVPLPSEVYAAAKDRIAKDMPGTHYLDAEGNKREGGVTVVYKPENLPQ